MTANIIVDIQVTDPIGYEEYKKLAPPCFELYGGKYIARGGRTEILDIENSEQAKKWRTSAEYSHPGRLRHKTVTSNMVVIDGV